MSVNRSSIYHSDYKQTGIYSCAQFPFYIPNKQILDCLNSKAEVPLYNMPRRPNKHVRIINNDRRRPCDSDGVCAAMAHKPNNQRDPCDPCVPKLRPLLICKDCGCCYRERTGAVPNPNQMKVIKLCGYTGEDTNDMLFTVDPEEVAENFCEPSMDSCPCKNCCRRRRAPKHHAEDCPCRFCEKKHAPCLNAEYFKWVRATGGYDEDCAEEDMDDHGDCCGNGYAPSPPQVASCGQSVMINGASVNCHCCIVYADDSSNPTSCPRPCPAKPTKCRFGMPRGVYSLANPCCPCPPKKQVCRCCYCQIAAKHQRALHGPNCCCMKCIKYRKENPCRPAGIRYPLLKSRKENCDVNIFWSTDPPPAKRCALGHGPLCTCSEESKAQAAGCPFWCKNDKETCLCHRFAPNHWERRAPCDKRMCAHHSSGPRAYGPGTRLEWPDNGGICGAPEIDQTFEKSRTVTKLREEASGNAPSLKSSKNTVRRTKNTTSVPTQSKTKVGSSSSKQAPSQQQSKSMLPVGAIGHISSEKRPASPTPAARRLPQTTSATNPRLSTTTGSKTAAANQQTIPKRVPEKAHKPEDYIRKNPVMLQNHRYNDVRNPEKPSADDPAGAALTTRSLNNYLSKPKT